MFNILRQMLELYRWIFWMAIGATWQKIIWLDDICGKGGLFRGLETIVRSGDYRLCGNGNDDDDAGGNQFDVIMRLRSLYVLNLHKVELPEVFRLQPTSTNAAGTGIIKNGIIDFICS
jgi:hypothetical protein